MGNLFFINESLEFANFHPEQRDIKFINFCKAMNLAKLDKDNLYATEDIFTIQYSYGNVFNDLFYKSWSEIKTNPNLTGISSTAHSLFQSILFAVPSMISVIKSYEDFLSAYQEQNFGHTGIEQEKIAYKPFICCSDTWNEWKSRWLAKNQKLINWEVTEHPFLPNKKISDQILLREIIKHGKESELVEKYENKIGLAFHQEIMKHKGSQIEAYTLEIGTAIVESNYYRHETELSRAEQLKAHSPRNIFSLISSNGSIQYISLDHAHGMFEFHNSLGDHLGEFKFDGSYNSKAEVDHSLRTL